MNWGRQSFTSIADGRIAHAPKIQIRISESSIVIDLLYYNVQKSMADDSASIRRFVLFERWWVMWVKKDVSWFRILYICSSVYTFVNLCFLYDKFLISLSTFL